MEAAEEPTTANNDNDADNYNGKESFGGNDLVINRLSTGEAKTQESSEDAGLDGIRKEKEKKLDEAEEEEAEAAVEAIEALSFSGKVFRTIAVYASYFAVALSLGILGPSLTDLELVTSSSTTEISAVFTCRGVLAIVGSLVLGPLLDRINRYLLVGVALVMDFVFYVVIPWCRTLPLLLAALSPPEFFNCLIGMGTHLIIIGIWKDDAQSRSSLQLLNLVSVLGFMTAPLLVKPFLSASKGPQSPPTNESFGGNWTNGHPTHTKRQFDQLELVNASSETLLNVRYKVEGLNVPTSPALRNLTSFDDVTEDVTTVYVFVVVAVYSLIVGVIMLAIYVRDNNNDNNDNNDDNDNTGPSGTPGNNQQRSNPGDGAAEKAKEAPDAAGDAGGRGGGGRRMGFVAKVSLLYFAFNFFYGGIEIGYAGLVSTFAVKYLGWSTDDGSEVTAVVQAANAVLTAAAVVLSRYIRPQTFVTWNVVAVVVSLAALCLLVEHDPVWLWVCTALLGASYASIMPSSISWVDSFMPVDGRFSSAYWAGFFSGFMAVPGLTGYMFNAVHPMAFPYGMLICAVATAAVYAVLCLTVRYGTSTVEEYGGGVEMANV